MDLRGDVERILPLLPEVFSEAELDRWVAWLAKRHREMDVSRRLPRVLDALVAEGRLELEEPRVWRNPAARTHTSETLPLALHQGDLTTREELAEILGMDGPAALNRGMFKRSDGPFRDQLLLFHDPEANPYGDVVGEHVIHYVGQGMEGDQKLQSYNRYLAEHLKRGLTVHFFEKEPDAGPGNDLRYRGEVVCEEFERVYRPDERRSVLEFRLVPFDPIFAEAETTPVDYYREVQGEIAGFAGQPRFVDRPVRTTVASRLVRDVAFRDIVLDAYRERCAVCGDSIHHEGLTELQAAHIVGVAERGPDDPRNGLSLCGRHHWAFDHGVFTVSDGYEVVSLLEGEDPHGEIRHGEEILLPQAETRWPHPWYLQYHREKWVGAV